MIHLALMTLMACPKAEPDDSAVEEGCDAPGGCLVAEGLSAGLLSVRTGPAEGELWIVGATPDPADGSGPMLLHLSDGAWERLDTSAWAGAELWWAWIGEEEQVFVGNQGLILERDGASGALTAALDVPAELTFFGVWGASADQLWAVGQTEGDGPPALWRRDEGSWAAWEDPQLGPGEDGDVLFKVHGRSADELWIVGSGGQALAWDGEALTPEPTDSDVDTSNAPLLTVDATGEAPIAVGGLGNGLILERLDGTWRDVSPDFQPGFNGVCATPDGEAWAVGQYGTRAERGADGAWISDTDKGLSPPIFQDWHGCAIDGEGGLWTVGGRISTRPLIEGVIGYEGPTEPPALTLD